MHSICMVLPYFGKAPNYFNFWLQSVKNNPTINWLIFTDCNLDDGLLLMENVKIHEITFEKFRLKIQANFSFKITLDNPYKLCDYKIFYGQVLKEYLIGFDFWGFCDCDLIWGNIRKFVTPDMLANYNFLFGLGPFQIHRTNDPIYMKAIEQTKALGKYNFKHVLTNSENFVIDELPFGLPIAYYNLSKDKYYNEFAIDGRPYDAPDPKYYHFVDTYNSRDELGRAYENSMYYKFKESVPFWNRDKALPKRSKKYQIYKYSDGTLERLYLENGILKTEELMYVHFRSRKFKINVCDTNRYLIVPNKFIKHNEHPSRLFMAWHGRNRILNYSNLNLSKISVFLKRQVKKIKLI